METGEDKKASGKKSKEAALRDKWVGVRFTTAEYEALKKKAAEAGITLSRFLRQAANGATIFQRLSDEGLNYVRQLAGMSTNLNQMAHKGHAEGFIYVANTLSEQGEKIDLLIKKIRL